MVATTRPVVNEDLDARNLLFALNLVARELGHDSVTRDEYRATRRAARRAARDGRRRELERLLPNVAQLERLGGGEWDVELAAAGLEPREGGKLTPAGETFAAEIRKEAGIAEFDRDKKRKAPVRLTKRATIGLRQPPNERSGRAKGEPLAERGRNGAQLGPTGRRFRSPRGSPSSPSPSKAGH